MKLFTTITSERGKPVTKSGNKFIKIQLIDENRQSIADIYITEGDIDINYHDTKTKVNTLAFEDIPW